MTAILSPNNKKRDRLNMTSSSTTTTSSQSQQEEYEAALSFLRDFHSKQVSSGDMILHSLHSPSEQLDSIIESSTDGNGSCTMEDVLSSDFSLALSVGRSSESSLASSSHSSCDVSQPSHSPLQQQRRGHKEKRRIMPSTINLSPTLPPHHQPQTPIASNKRSRMKKCSTSECLLDLISNDNTTPTTGGEKLPSFPTLSKRNEGIYNPSRLRCPPSPTRYEEGRDEQYSHYLDLGSGYAGQEQHVAKRHRM